MAREVWGGPYTNRGVREGQGETGARSGVCECVDEVFLQRNTLFGVWVFFFPPLWALPALRLEAACRLRTPQNTKREFVANGRRQEVRRITNSLLAGNCASRRSHVVTADHKLSSRSKFYIALLHLIPIWLWRVRK